MADFQRVHRAREMEHAPLTSTWFVGPQGGASHPPPCATDPRGSRSWLTPGIFWPVPFGTNLHTLGSTCSSLTEVFVAVADGIPLEGFPCGHWGLIGVIVQERAPPPEGRVSRRRVWFSGLPLRQRPHMLVGLGERSGLGSVSPFLGAKRLHQGQGHGTWRHRETFLFLFPAGPAPVWVA